MLFLSEFEQVHHAFLLSNNITIFFNIYTTYTDMDYFLKIIQYKKTTFPYY